MILDEILAHKRLEVEERHRRRGLEVVRQAAAAAGPARGFRAALRQPGLSVIAEVKRRSPAAGVLREAVVPEQIAAVYERAGARAISVLTDQRFFDGSDEDLTAVHGRVQLPVLRKDFVVDEYQVWEARAMGADAVLLIVRALEQAKLAHLLGLVRELGMDALVEVHDEVELERALAVEADVIGINNRDLGTMQVDLGTTLRLRPRVPPHVTLVSESGIRGPADVRPLLEYGVDAILVGEALMSAPDPEEALRCLISTSSDDPSAPRGASKGEHRTRVKICGITSVEEARAALEAGADMLGFVFYRPVRRYVEPLTAASIVESVRGEFPERDWKAVGVFVNEPEAEVNVIAEQCGMDLVQLCGEEPPEYCARMSRPAIKVLRARDQAWTGARLEEARRGFEVARFMVDSHVNGFYGGTGVATEWSGLAGLMDGMILAGGLRPDNVRQALEVTRPWGLDVSTGVERDNHKDPALVRGFIEEVRAFDEHR